MFSIHRHVHRTLKDRYERFYHPRHRFGRWHMLMDSVLAITVLTLILYNGYLFGFKPLFLRPPLEVSVRVSAETLSVGGAATLEITYAYHGNRPLQQTTILVKAPQSFEFDRAEPSEGFDATTSQWTLPELKPGLRGTLKFSGRQWSVNGRQEPFTVTASAAASEGNPLTTIVDGWIETRIPFVQAKTSIPSTIVLGQETTVSLTLNNPTNRALPPMRVKATLPDGWTTKDASPALDQNTWNIESIEANGTRIFSLRGQYKALPESPAFFFSVRRAQDDQELLSVRSDTTIADPALDLRASADVAGPIEPGAEIPVTITYVNRGDFSLENVTIELTPRGVYVNPDRLTSEGATVSNGTVTWTPEKIKDLRQIVPSQRGQLRMKVVTKPTVSLVDHSPLDDFSVILQPVAQLRLPILPNQPVTWYGSTTGVAVNSALGMEAFAQYYTPEGEQVGRGAFPLKVGRKTSVWVKVNLTNTIHDLYTTRVALALPPHVQWTNRSSVTMGLPIQWDAATNALIWKLDRLDHMLGANPRSATASVELAIVPSSDLAGRAAPLVSSITATGVDGVTKANRSFSLPELTSSSAKTATVDGTVRP